MEKEFLSAISDVVWRFHVYGQYGKDSKKALKALAKRAPGYSDEFYKESFDLNLKLLIATIEAVKNAPTYYKPEQIYSKYSDIDTKYVLDNLQKLFPQENDEFIKSQLSRVIFWFYLK